MTKSKILLVEDDEDIQELVRFNLAKEGYQVTAVESGEEGLRAIRDETPDLILLDLMLPGMDGLEVCRSVRRDKELPRMPIIMVTARGEEADIVAGLELGADDYITKPFSPRVLVARVRSVLRRGTDQPVSNNGVLRVHELVMHPGRREARVGERQLALTSTEFDVLRLLAGRPGWVFTRNQIVDGVRGQDYHVTERSVDVQIVSIRKKLGEAAHYVETVRGVGYRFKE